MQANIITLIGEIIFSYTELCDMVRTLTNFNFKQFYLPNIPIYVKKLQYNKRAYKTDPLQSVLSEILPKSW